MSPCTNQEVKVLGLWFNTYPKAELICDYDVFFGLNKVDTSSQ